MAAEGGPDSLLFSIEAPECYYVPQVISARFLQHTATDIAAVVGVNTARLPVRSFFSQPMQVKR